MTLTANDSLVTVEQEVKLNFTQKPPEQPNCECGGMVREVFAPFYSFHMCPDCGAQSQSGHEITGEDSTCAETDGD